MSLLRELETVIGKTINGWVIDGRADAKALDNKYKLVGHCDKCGLRRTFHTSRFAPSQQPPGKCPCYMIGTRSGHVEVVGIEAASNTRIFLKIKCDCGYTGNVDRRVLPKYCSKSCTVKHLKKAESVTRLLIDDLAALGLRPTSIAKIAGISRQRIDQLTNVDKDKARKILHRAIDAGIILRGVCEVCGIKEVDAHHDDYTRPLAVRWLCKEHHYAAHAKANASKREPVPA